MNIKSKSGSCLSRDYVDVITVERHLHPRSLNLKLAEQHFLGSCILIKKYSKGSHLRKCQSLHLIKTCKIWPLKGTSVLSPANCLRYEFCEQKSVPAKHVFLKIKKFISMVFRGWFEGSQKDFLFWRVLGVLYHWFDAGFTWTQVRHNSQQGHIFPSQNFMLLALYKCQHL